MPTSAPTNATTLPQWLGDRVRRHGQRIAVTFVADDRSEQSWTYEELWSRASTVASRLPLVEETSPRALMLFPPGLEFVAGFLGCQIAGWAAVPTCYPKPGREMPRFDSSASDCSPAAILADQATLDALNVEKLSPAARHLPRVATNVDSAVQGDWIDPGSLCIDADSLAFLQYTSGSTSDPKGVMVSHRNLMSNLESIRCCFQVDFQDDDTETPERALFWLPFFHDMGLIGGILEPLYLGITTILMSPRSFLQRPIRWLQWMSEYRVAISGAPNFAYQLCVDRISPEQTDNIDLRHWRIAFCGAEPILPRTLQDFGNRFAACGFSSSSFYPCYGLAEATLLVAGGEGPAEPETILVDRVSLAAGTPKVVPTGRGREFQKLVSCGSAAKGCEVTIVDPQTCEVVGERQVGEIWLRGSSLSAGYWNRDEENQQRFNARLADGQSGYFRSGDLGFLHHKKLFVTGRLKDLIIVRGRNLFPQDIEATIRETVGSEAGQCAAFAVDAARGEALAIVAELPRRFDESKLADLVLAMRRAVIEVHDVDPRHIRLVRQATVPLTSSGKVQRSRCRQLFESDEMPIKYRYDRASGSEQTPIPIPEFPKCPSEQDRQPMIDAIAVWLAEWLVVRAGVEPADIDPEKPFAQYGLDSMTAVELSGEIEDWSGVELTPMVAWNHPTISRMCLFISEQLFVGSDSPQSNTTSCQPAVDDLLEEVGQVAKPQVDHAAVEKRGS